MDIKADMSNLALFGSSKTRHPSTFYSLYLKIVSKLFLKAHCSLLDENTTKLTGVFPLIIKIVYQPENATRILQPLASIPTTIYSAAHTILTKLSRDTRRSNAVPKGNKAVYRRQKKSRQTLFQNKVALINIQDKT